MALKGRVTQEVQLLSRSEGRPRQWIACEIREPMLLHYRKRTRTALALDLSSLTVGVDAEQVSGLRQGKKPAPVVDSGRRSVGSSPKTQPKKQYALDPKRLSQSHGEQYLRHEVLTQSAMG